MVFFLLLMPFWQLATKGIRSFYGCSTVHVVWLMIVIITMFKTADVSHCVYLSVFKL